MDLFRRQLSLKLAMYSYLIWLGRAVSLVRKNIWHQMFWCTIHIKIACTFFPSEIMWIFHSKSQLLFGWQSSWISLGLLFLQLHSRWFLRPVYGFLCLLCICFYGILHLLFFTHAYPQISNKTCANHMCLCFWWWHAPMFLWKLVLFFQKVELLLTMILKSAVYDN